MKGLLLFLFLCAIFLPFALESSRTQAISEYTGLHPKRSSSYPCIYIFLYIPIAYSIPFILYKFFTRQNQSYDLNFILSYFSVVGTIILFDKYAYKLFLIYYKKTISRDDFISKIKADTFQFLTEENKKLTFLEISKENLKLYKNKLRRNLITEEIFFNLVNENIDLHLKYFYDYNYAFNQILQYSLENNKIYTIEEIEKSYTIRINPQEYLKNDKII